jgi:Holliday junction resolvase RusA-like endonuclease
MKKIESEYRDLYGDIPKDEIERFKYLLDKYDDNKNIKKYLSDRIKDILNIKWKHEKITIYLVPKATPRPRHNMLRNTFYVIGAKDNKDIFLKFMKKIDIDIITTPCKFTCISYLPIPKQMTPIETVLAEMGLIRPITKPDWDNLGKTYSDMIQG